MKVQKWKEHVSLVCYIIVKIPIGQKLVRYGRLHFWTYFGSILEPENDRFMSSANVELAC